MSRRKCKNYANVNKKLDNYQTFLIKINKRKKFICGRKRAMKNLIDIKDLNKQEIDELIKVAKDIIQNKEKYLR